MSQEKLEAELIEWVAEYKDIAERHALAENPNESATYLLSLFESAGYRLIPELRVLSDEEIRAKLEQIQPEGFDWANPTDSEMIKFKAISEAAQSLIKKDLELQVVSQGGNDMKRLKMGFLCFEWGIDDLLVLRLPFKFGISFYRPQWQVMFGIARKRIGIEWDFGPFEGEAWKE